MKDPSSKGVENEIEESLYANDDEVIERIKNGERDAYRILFLKYHRRLIRVIWHMIGNMDDTEELVQDIFYKAYRGIKEFKSGSSFYTWLYRIALNAVIDFKRKNKMKYSEYLDHIRCRDGFERLFMDQTSCSPDRDIERRETLYQLMDALKNISDKHRTILILREVEGLSYIEIAKILGCSQGTVMSRLFYARKRLKEHFLKVKGERKDEE